MTTKVLWVVKGLGPGGAERLLVAAAGAHDRDRFVLECAYVLPWKDHLVGELEAAGVRTHCLSRTRADLRWPLRLARLVRDGEYDIVHGHSPLPSSVARLAVRSMPASQRPGVVVTEHNRWPTHRLPTRLVNRATSRWDDADFAVTDEVKDSMRGSCGDRVVTLRHGIDLTEAASALDDRASVRAELGIADGEIAIGTVANFREQKDYPNLLRAASRVGGLDVPIRVVAVGQGPLEGEIRALQDELGLGDRVMLTGFRSDAVRVMAACDVFTLASRWEGLPVAVMEALALGLPLVTTDVGGMAEEFTDGVDALLVPPGDDAALAAAWERVAEDADLRRQLADRAAIRAPEFGVERTVAVIEATYAEVARVRPPVDPPAEPARRRSAPPFEIRPATDDDRSSVLALLRDALGGDGDERYPDLFAWKHDTNCFGRSPMWVACESDRIVAFRSFMRWEFVRGGVVLRAVRAVDTATHPDFEGRGLFRALTMHALDAVREDGVDFVFNTPNSQSRPGYLKMGWREVGRLPAGVRFTGPGGAMAAVRSRVPAERWSERLDLGVTVQEWLASGGPGDRWPAPVDVREIRTRLDESFLRWRFGEAMLGYRVVDDGECAVVCRLRRRGSARELAVVSEFGERRGVARLAGRAARDADASYAIRIGQDQNPSSLFVPLPGGGPILTWRAVNDCGEPPLANWALTLGDIELF